MPELPEVQTTVNGLKKLIIGLAITDVWSNYRSEYYLGSETIKDPAYYSFFKKEAVGKEIISVERRAKNILINLDSGLTILIHLKMTGHLLFGRYEFDSKNKKDPWNPIGPEALKEPYNRYVRLMFTLSNGFHLALSDVRRFAKTTIVPTEIIHDSPHLLGLGPEPLHAGFTIKKFGARLSLRPAGKIKQVLTDQTIIAGLGNIYADETLWRAGIHPATLVKDIPKKRLLDLFHVIKKTLHEGISLGGDSMSDYRNVHGEKGSFQEEHCAYRMTGKACKKKGCGGTIRRMVLGGRSTHYCDVHQRFAGSSVKKAK